MGDSATASVQQPSDAGLLNFDAWIQENEEDVRACTERSWRRRRQRLPKWLRSRLDDELGADPNQCQAEQITHGAQQIYKMTCEKFRKSRTVKRPDFKKPPNGQHGWMAYFLRAVRNRVNDLIGDEPDLTSLKTLDSLDSSEKVRLSKSQSNLSESQHGLDTLEFFTDLRTILNAEEMSIVTLVFDGYKNKEIAAELGIARNRVYAKVASAWAKLANKYPWLKNWKKKKLK